LAVTGKPLQSSVHARISLTSANVIGDDSFTLNVDRIKNHRDYDTGAVLACRAVNYRGKAIGSEFLNDPSDALTANWHENKKVRYEHGGGD